MLREISAPLRAIVSRPATAAVAVKWAALRACVRRPLPVGAILAALLITASVPGCGIKGALRQPPPPAAPAAAASDPAAAPAPAETPAPGEAPPKAKP